MLAVIDTETTGLDPEQHELVELAIVTLTGRTDVEFSKLCRPSGPIDPVASAAHHLTADMLRDEVSPARCLEIAHQSIPGLDSATYVAHNAQFDRRFLARLSPAMGDESRWICTYRCAMHVWPDAPSFGNQALRYYLSVMPRLPAGLYPHRALYDAIVTSRILMCLLGERTLDELVQLSTAPVLLRKVGFGKHFGLLWQDVPGDYLSWVVRQQDMDPDVRHTARHWLLERRRQ